MVNDPNLAMSSFCRYRVRVVMCTFFENSVVYILKLLLVFLAHIWYFLFSHLREDVREFTPGRKNGLSALTGPIRTAGWRLMTRPGGPAVPAMTDDCR